MRFSVMITTRNRMEDLRKTLEMIRRLDPPPDEIMVTADGCSDATVDMLRNDFPHASITVNEINLGSVGSRDQMMRRAKGGLVFALDDDSYPEHGDCLTTISTLFESNPNLAVLHFPQRTDEYAETLSADFPKESRLTKSFPNSGAVLRTEHYRKLPGFVAEFFHMYEEPDFALQCFDAGFEVRYESSITIRHHYSSQARSEMRNHHRHARNEFWSTLIRCPAGLLPVMLLYRVFSQFRYAVFRGPRWIVCEPKWWFSALAGVLMCLKQRTPVGYRAYIRWLRAG